MVAGGAPGNAGTVVANRGERDLVWVGFPLLGAGAGWLLESVAGWVAALPWAPFQGPFELVASIADRPFATVGAIVLGAAAGLVLAYLAVQDMLAVSVSDEQVTLTRGDSRHDIERGPVSAVFLDRKQLVLLGTATEELAREKSDLGADRLREAFLAHGYPWHADGDPYRNEYRRWVEDMPDLPADANALFKARARALDKGDSDDAADLRAELAKLGVVVREEKKRQYWRRTGRLPEAPGDPG